MTTEFELRQLVDAGFADFVQGDASIGVSGVKHDSRCVAPGDLFAAIGAGERFASDAIERGAVAVLAERPLDLGVPTLVCADTLAALAQISRHIYADPTADMTVVGITGTNGKTTTAYLLEAILQRSGAAVGVIGTIEFRGPSGTRPATHTTPMADDLMRVSRWMADGGATHIVMEVSSHGLAMRRADGVRFAVAAFTNLSQDHLDYHGDLEAYEQAKRRLFEDLAPGTLVINIDDPAGARIAAAAVRPTLRCSKHADSTAEIRVLSFHVDRGGIRARVAMPSGELTLASPLIGEHNLENLLVVLGCAHALGVDPNVAASALAEATGAPGRLERIETRDDLVVFVDYAHTPDALERVLGVLRPITDARLWALFGCGGDRDAGKRPLMGAAAARVADIVVLTNDNPRSEDPNAILQAVEVGVRDVGMPCLPLEDLGAASRGYAVEPDRRTAIRAVLRAASSGDTVLIAGKGHEKVQIIGERREPFDDVDEARAALSFREAG